MTPYLYKLGHFSTRFRWWVVGQARRLRLDGWTRNRMDGSVEVLAIGEEAALDRLAALCAEGPPAAQVLSVERRPAEDDGARGFEQRPTA